MMTSERALLLGMAVLVASWLKFALDNSPLVFLADAAFRGFLLVVLASWLAKGWGRDGLLMRPVQAGLAAIALGPAIVMLDAVVTASLAGAGVYHNSFGLAWGGYPDYAAAWIRLLDLSVGLALVAVSEELVFRRLFAAVADRRGWSPLALYSLSAIAFGLLHSPQGVLQVLITGLAGLLLMAAYRRFGGMAVPVVGHYVANLLFFSDVLHPAAGA